MGFYHSSSWLASDQNMLADATSHFEYARLFLLTPHMKWKPCPIHPQLHGIKHSLTSCPGQPASCGMAWHPRPAQPIGQEKNHSMISLPYTLNSETLMAQHFQCPKLQSWNGPPGLEVPRGSIQRLSKPTSHIYGQLMSTQTCSFQPVSHPCSNKSNMGSR